MRLGQARHEIDRFFWNDFCDTYIELAKERLYSAERQGTDARRAAQYALYHAFFTVLKLYAPFAPHITETIYLEFFRKFEPESSLHLTRWPQTGEPEEQLLLFGERLKENLSAMRRRRRKKGFPPCGDGLLPDSYGRKTASTVQEAESDLLSCSHAESLKLLPL